MKQSAIRVLFVDDDEAMRDVAEADLGSRGFEVVTADSGETAVTKLRGLELDAVVTDLNMKGLTGLDVCRAVGEVHPDVPVIVLTAFGSMESAIDAMRAGAYDFVNKPVDLEQLALQVERAADHRRLRAEVKRLRERVAEPEPTFAGLVGESEPMKQVYDLVNRVARTDVGVLITGETGSGKELVAKAIHEASDRADGPFVAVNVAAMPESLLESELFGHVKGAFTGANKNRTGLFVQASGGTLLLDELGEMSMPMQVKLLRALEQGRVRPVGSDEEVPYDARIIAATNRELEDEIDKGEFREDLYYRLNVVRIEVPPLRERGNDILLLAQHFLKHFADQFGVEVDGIDPVAAARLLNHPWPGNVRELLNSMQRAVALTRHDKITVDDLPDQLRNGTSAAAAASIADDQVELVPLSVVERRHIEAVLEAVDGNRTVASDILGLDRKTLYRKLKRYAKKDAAS